jgi:hypothetical protein
MATESPSFKEDRPARKPYERPRLEVYGDIRTVTEAIGHSGNDDGGTHTSNKTQ